MQSTQPWSAAVRVPFSLLSLLLFIIFVVFFFCFFFSFSTSAISFLLTTRLLLVLAAWSAFGRSLSLSKPPAPGHRIEVMIIAILAPRVLPSKYLCNTSSLRRWPATWKRPFSRRHVRHHTLRTQRSREGFGGSFEIFIPVTIQVDRYIPGINAYLGIYRPPAKTSCGG